MTFAALQSLLFRLDPERAHGLSLKALDLAEGLGLSPLLWPPVEAPLEVMGLSFPNAVGLAAGLDKNAEYLDGLAALGFGFLEVGTVTPRPQPGNPRPRLFRLPQRQAIINRMGFNNRGLEYLVRRIDASRYEGILGVNIGKNYDTPLESAHEDYLRCLRRVYTRASYVTLNLSSPNTPGLRALQTGASLRRLLAVMHEERERLAGYHGRRVPLVIKLAPDLDEAELDQAAEAFLDHRPDAVMATNTTLSRAGIADLELASETGGLSGRPLESLANQVLEGLADRLQGEIPLIGVGGILDAEGARRKQAAGASLVQVYTGLIYRGPMLVREAARALAGQGALL